MWTLGRKIAAGFAMSFLLLLGIGVVAYRSTDALTKTSYLVAHTHLVMERVAGVLSQMKDAETGQRGFVITGDPTYLEPYLSAEGSVPALVRDLRELTADNPNQQKRLDEAEPLIAERLAVLMRIIDVRRSAGLDQAATTMQLGEGKRLMDGIRRVFDRMDNEERQLLKLRGDEVEAAASGARSTIVFGTLLCLLFVSVTGVLLTRSLTAQIAAA